MVTLKTKPKQTVKLLWLGMFLLVQGCVVNSSVLISKDTIAINHNVSLSEKLLRLLFL